MPSETSSAKNPQTGGFHYAFAIVAACIVMMGIPCAMALSCAGIFYTPVAEYFAVPKAQVSLYMSIMGVAMIIALPIAERLVKKVNFRYVLTGCMALDGLGFLAMSQAQGLWVFYAAGVALGLGVAPILYLAIPSLINSWFRTRMGFFIGLCVAFTGIGGVIFNPIGTALINSSPEGWRMAYLVFAIIVLAVALPVVFIFVRSKPSDKGLEPYGATDESDSKSNQPASEGIEAAQAIKSPTFFAVLLFTFLATMNLTTFQFFPAYCQSFGVEEIALAAGAVASACMAGQALGKVALGAISDHNVKAGLLFAIVLGVAGVLLLWLGGPLLATLMVGSFLFGGVYPCAAVESPILTRHAFGLRDYTTIYARISLGGAVAAAIAPAFWGIIADLPNGYTIMFILSLVFMACLLLLGLFTLTQKRKGEAA